jgi:DNA end-binding protein Ku
MADALEIVMRAIWSGEIAFGLVTIPAKLYSATKDLTPQFHQLHKECGSRISMVRRCPKCAKDVQWEEIGKGYEVSKGEYALFTKEELDKIEGTDAAGGIDIAEFIDPLEVDLAYIDKSYWVGPGGKSARGFDLLRTVLKESKKVALAKVKIRTRTRLALLRPRCDLFALDMMRYAEELVAPDEIVVPDTKPVTPRELQLAEDLVKQLTGPFDPTRHPDEYRTAVLAAVEKKVEADELARDTAEEGDRAAAAAGGGKVIDLAELLSRSLGVTEKPGPAKARPANEQATSDEAPPKEAAKAPKKGGSRETKKRAAG